MYVLPKKKNKQINQINKETITIRFECVNLIQNTRRNLLQIKGSFASKRGQENFNPYSQGNVCLNCFHILCGPITPSLIDR